MDNGPNRRQEEKGGGSGRSKRQVSLSPHKCYCDSATEVFLQAPHLLREIKISFAILVIENVAAKI